jgi:hypothetical protein
VASAVPIAPAPRTAITAHLQHAARVRRTNHTRRRRAKAPTYGYSILAMVDFAATNRGSVSAGSVLHLVVRGCHVSGDRLYERGLSPSACNRRGSGMSSIWPRRNSTLVTAARSALRRASSSISAPVESRPKPYAVAHAAATPPAEWSRLRSPHGPDRYDGHTTSRTPKRAEVPARARSVAPLPSVVAHG